MTPTDIDIIRTDAPYAPGRLYLAYLGGACVGHLYVSTETRGRLDSEVARNLRRRGVATALYMAAVADLGQLEACLAEQSPDAWELWQALAARGYAVSRSARYATLSLKPHGNQA